MGEQGYWNEERLKRLSGEIDAFEGILEDPGLAAGQRKTRLRSAARSCSDDHVAYLLGRDLDQPEHLERAIILARGHVETLRENNCRKS